MKRFDSIKLIRKVEPYRNEVVLLDGEWVPKSAAMLVSMLDAETDPENRFQIFGHVLVECRLADKTAVAVAYARARYLEFRDVTSLIAYSNALTDNGDLTEGLARAKEALDLAIKARTLINDAAGNYVRESLKTGSAEAVNQALHALVESVPMPREGDCALEGDWADKAEALGADEDIIAWIRAATSRD